METVSNWRATYVPGRWVVLAGPTSLVVMQPPPSHMSSLLSDLWHDVVSAADVSDLAAKFAAFRLDLMPHFAAFFWAADGMHSLVRGSLRAVNAETGEVLATGEGFHTWNEVGLGDVRQVRVEMEDEDSSDALQLPLAVGVVLAATITVDATDKIPLVLPTAVAAPEVAPEDSADEATEVIPEQGFVEEPEHHEPDEEPESAVAEEPAAEYEPALDDEVADEAPAASVPSLSLVAPLAEPEVEEPAEYVPDEPAPSPVEVQDEEPAFAAEQSLPIQYADPEPLAEPEPAEYVAEDHDAPTYDEPVAPAWPDHAPADDDAWGVQDTEAVAPVGMVVDEDGDGIPDAPQSDLDLSEPVLEQPPAPVALVVPEAQQAPGFPGFPGAQVAQNQGGFLPGGVPAPAAPQGPPWNQGPQDPYGNGYPGAPGQPYPPQFGGPQFGGPQFGGQPPQGFPPPQAPQFGGQPPQFGQPQPPQQPGPYGPPQPAYPQNPPYNARLSPAPMSSPVPAPYAPAAPLPQAAGVPSEPSLPQSQDSADTGDSTVFSTGIAMTHKPVAPRPGAENLVLAVVCALGHPNPQGIPACRVCRQPVDNANPRLVHRPVLAQLVTAGGARVELIDTVLIGRAPSAQAGDGNPILLPVPSPNSDISRTHLKVAVRNWEIIATDLHSTNGTMVVRPGQAPVRMVPGSPVTVEPGTILDLGDGGVITVGLPA